MSHGRRISVIGLGYVGLPVAVAFGRTAEVVAFDINVARVAELSEGRDSTGEVSAADLKAAKLRLTTDPADIVDADFHIVTVPTPINEAKEPDLSPLVAASHTVGQHLKKGDIVVYESTVYPGVTEDVCAPVLEAESALVCGTDFTLGYSPERINPGDQVHRFETITKVVSGQDAKTLEAIAKVYESVVTAGVYRASTIKTAEAAKVIENTQRDLNIALMNELALIFDRMDIDTHAVLAAAGTKWNFLPFTPGLVGGHCIGVDPYYLTHKAEELGYHPQVILAGRRINDGMGAHIADATFKQLRAAGRDNGGKPRITVLGLTFKENVPDFRNTRAVDVVRELKALGAELQVHDPMADPVEVKSEYGIELTDMDGLAPAHAVVLTVAHTQYVDGGWGLVSGLLDGGEGVVTDVRGVLPHDNVPRGINLWRL